MIFPNSEGEFCQKKIFVFIIASVLYILTKCCKYLEIHN